MNHLTLTPSFVVYMGLSSHQYNLLITKSLSLKMQTCPLETGSNQFLYPLFSLLSPDWKEVKEH